MPASLEHKQRVLAHQAAQQAIGKLGKLPWRIVRTGDDAEPIFVEDAAGNNVDMEEPVIAQAIVNAVNERNKIFGDNVNYRDVMSSLFELAYALPKSDGRKRMLDIIEKTLHPKDDLQ